MEIIATEQIRRLKRFKINKKLLLKLTIGGGAVFWLTSVATSLLPIAAEYRAAFTNWSIQAVWVGSLFMGMVIGCSVSYLLLRFFEKSLAKAPILKSVIISFIALAIAVILIDVPMILHEPGTSLFFLLIGITFNTVRFLFLGIAVGSLHKKLYSVKVNVSEDFRQAN